MPRRVDEMSLVPLVKKGEQGLVYHLVDEKGGAWALKKFFPETDPGETYSHAVRNLIPAKRGFESGFERQVLEPFSLAREAYADLELAAWIDGAVLMPGVSAPTWADLVVSIHEGATLSKVERLLLCQKLSEQIGWLESVGLAHRDVSRTNVLVDSLNIEIHLIDWDSLYHPLLPMPANAVCGTKGYLAPFLKFAEGQDAQTTWLENSDRFALAILSVELLIIGASLPPAPELISQNDLYHRSGRDLRAVREALRHTLPAAGKLFEAALAARSFAECPRPSDWIAATETELTNKSQSVWEEEIPSVAETQTIYAEDYAPHFVKINRSALVQIDQTAFVTAPASGWR
jgi:serine/threonine protein kinase